VAAGELIAASLGGVGGVVLTVVSDTIRETRRSRARDHRARLEHIEEEVRALREEIANTKEHVAGVDGVVRGITGGKFDRRGSR
jgi:hypothetical protein